MKVTPLVVAALAVVTLTGCTETAPRGTPARPPSPPTSPTTASDTEVSTFAPLRCGRPTSELVHDLLDRVGVGGEVTAATLVPTVTTRTGNWYVLGIDQDVDLGTLPSTDSYRSLAVVDAEAEVPRIIQLTSASTSSRHHATWRNVSWTGDTLARGKRAVARAVSCLDGAS